jgi:four helix bundle protein
LSDTVRSYRDLVVWQRGMSVAISVYELTRPFPTEEKFGLVNQMRRAAVSIPSNIAEGHARARTVEYCRFLSIAMGSVAELETQLLLCKDLGFASASDVDELLEQLETLGRMLRGLYKALERRQ